MRFQKYIDTRFEDVNPQSGKAVLPETANKELPVVPVAFRSDAKYFAELEDLTRPDYSESPSNKKNLSGYTGDHILTYLHTNETRMRQVMNKCKGTDLSETLSLLYKEIKNGNIELPEFVERVGFLIKNG